MKFLLIILILMNVANIARAKSPQLRRIEEKTKGIKDLSDVHCNQFGSRSDKCKQDFSNKIDRVMFSLNDSIIKDDLNTSLNNINKIMNEENEVLKLRSYLDSVSISYTPVNNSSELQVLKDAYLITQEEIACIDNAKIEIDSEKCVDKISYNGTETCDELNFALSAVNYCNPIAP